MTQDPEFAKGAYEGGPEVVGYMLVDPNTGEPSWDGVIYSTLPHALDELIGTRDEWLAEPRPEAGDLPYELVTVVRDPALQGRALRHVQEHFDRLARAWERYPDG